MHSTFHGGGVGKIRIVGFHGWFGPENSWASIGRWLNPQRFSWLLPDLRGYGMRRLEAGEFTLNEAAADAVALADSLGWDRFSVMGHSMGALAAQHVLAMHPMRVQKLIAVTPVPASGIPFDPATRDFFSGAADSLDTRKMILDGSTGGRLHASMVDAMLRNCVLETDAKAFAGYFKSWSSANFADKLKGTSIPTKVMVGSNDPHVTLEFMQATFGSIFTNCQFVTLEGSGHYPMLETPLQFVSEIERFFAE
jgi:pimeloyl-ACP methyl ester carboxylesterase